MVKSNLNHGTVVGTLGNFSASIGKAKSKKTFNVSAIVAAALKNGTVYNDLAMNSKIMQQCRAFRVACEFLPESRAFSLPKLHPWLLNFCEDGHAYYVCEFKRGEELLLSDMIRSTGIQQEMRPVTRRVAILAPGANRSLISECGIKFFCTVDDDWDLAVTEAVPDDEVWNGVPVV